MIHSSSSINTPIVEVLHERPSLLRRTTSAVLLFTDQQPTRTPRTNTPRAHYTSLTFILQFVLWLLDFRFLAPFADDAHATWYAQRKTQQAIGTEHDDAFDRSLPVSSSVGLTHPYVCSNNNIVQIVSATTTTSGTPTRREYGERRKVLTTYPAALFHGTWVTRVSSTETTISFATITSDQLKLPQNAHTHVRTDKV